MAVLQCCYLHFFYILFLLCSVYAKRKNVVLFLTDDQDNFNYFVNTPLCCPSRSTLLTGLYQHNTRVLNNSIEGNCNSVEWQHKHEPNAFVESFYGAGYRTFYAGKYLNQYGSHKAGGLEHVPKGWQWWAGLKGNSRYYNYTLSVNGSAKHFPTSYLTDHIHELSLEFLKSQSAHTPPFFMMVAPPAPHAPYTPSPKYAKAFSNVSVPRTPNFNPSVQKDKHWMLRLPPNPLPSDVLLKIDENYRLRWRTLMSVDDMISSVIRAIDQIGLLEETYILVTSDNGYHLGHYGLPWDKRQPYDTDVRVPFFIRGPGVKRQALPHPVMTADIAPTLLDMAGLHIPLHMDGRSFLAALQSKRKRFKKRAFLIENMGEGGKSVSPECPWHGDLGLSNCGPESACKCQDARNNTYACVRSIGPNENSLFCKFNDEENFLEAYDMVSDPYQMKNIAQLMKKTDIQRYLLKLKSLQSCSGNLCIQL
ncbi:N-acetylglucosamine-6-sulfatase-like isoform X2 [Thrips palmi]|uniref:N-acetylglucosamine-6-sulfatase-like isoform X2 n=1 Tax=Thrips palmi TaxID=161013 RepID=A0A6P9A5K9_THRPL|nr:N-acetylglucosamine-6-sulfatase-like isoform X2 [Thrips palmi]